MLDLDYERFVLLHHQLLQSVSSLNNFTISEKYFKTIFKIINSMKKKFKSSFLKKIFFQNMEKL
jgi:hypothetical protein